MAHPIIRKKTRILRPFEWKLLMKGVTKPDYRTLARALLFTGMRYIELKRLQEYPSWFDGEFIHLPQTAVHKQLRTQMERSVRLNPVGRLAIEHFLLTKSKLPSWQSWAMNLKRWAGHVKLDPISLSVKTTRKTYESWLVFYYPERRFEVALSQGHTTATAMRHYLNMPFTEIDRLEMREFVEGW